jgi:hypothetical protein
MTDAIDVVSLETAILCVDCEAISSSSGTRCHVCASSAVLSLSRILGGPLRASATRDCDKTEQPGKLLDGLFVSVERAFSYAGGGEI